MGTLTRHFWIFGCVALVSSAALAQSPVANPVDESPFAKGPLAVTAANYKDFRRFLVPELTPLFRDGQLEMEAAAVPPYKLEYDSDWNKNSAAAAVQGLEVAGLRTALRGKRGFLFGSAAVLMQERDPGAMARKILWNIEGLFAQQKIIDSSFQFLMLHDNKLEHSQTGRLTRMYPMALADGPVNVQLFREAIRFISPAPLNGLAWLTFRFFGEDEDVLWLFSPAIHKLRQLTGSNRSDAILRSKFSPDDFIAWSGKPELISPALDQELVALAPVVRDDSLDMLPNEGRCSAIDRSLAVANHWSSRWNFEVGHFPRGAGWLPVTTTFVPRNLWRIELTQLDPFSSVGRQVLYVDKELMLPFYKFVYDRAGALTKVVLSTFGLATDSQKRRFPYSAYVLVYDLPTKDATIVDISKTLVCDQQVEGLKLTDLEPAKFLEGAAKAQPAQSPQAGPIEGPDEL